jgi:hypothetical protein
MRQACGIETHGLAYRQKFLQSYREASFLSERVFILSISPCSMGLDLIWAVPLALGGSAHTK